MLQVATGSLGGLREDSSAQKTCRHVYELGETDGKGGLVISHVSAKAG